MLARQAVLTEPSLQPTSQSSRPHLVLPPHLGLLSPTHSLEVARVFVAPGSLSPPESPSPPSELLAAIAPCENVLFLLKVLHRDARWWVKPRLPQGLTPATPPVAVFWIGSISLLGRRSLAATCPDGLPSCPFPQLPFDRPCVQPTCFLVKLHNKLQHLLAPGRA